MAQESDIIKQPPEAIRQQIETTRSNLTEKLETLEQEVKETVQGVKDTYQDAKSAVVDTVDAVKDSVKETVESVKETFDITRQVERHPWAMLSGSLAAGFIVGRLLPHEDWVSRAMSRSPQPGPPMPNGEARQSSVGFPAQPTAGAESPHLGAESGVLDELTAKFAPEIDKLKGLAIGAFCGLVRDAIKEAVPPNLSAQVEDLMDSFTSRLGGKPIAGSILEKPVDNRPTTAVG
jgi:ElaB/YqjD/DUF883 family membrane-anchored ribosome-binding protein